MSELQFAPLPVMEDIDGRHLGRRQGVAATSCWPRYHRLLDLGLKLWQYHFEFLNLGYAAYLDFFGFCKAAFPSIPDLAIAKMVAGIDVDLFRPDEELKKLARLAVELGIDDRFTGGDVSHGLAALRGGRGRPWPGSPSGTRRAQPWFNFSTGLGLLPLRQGLDREPRHPDRLHRRLHRQGQAGRESLDRPIAALQAERDRIVAEYRELLDSDEDRATFEAKLGSGAHGVPVRREPQLLRRALGALGGLAQDA